MLSCARSAAVAQLRRRCLPALCAPASPVQRAAFSTTKEAEEQPRRGARPKSLSDVMTASEKQNLKQGAWHDFVQVLNNNGKIQSGEDRLIAAEEALVFPSIKAKNLRGEQVDFPSCRGDSIKLVGFSFKQFGFEMVPTWINPFKARFERSSAVTTMQLCFIELSMLRYLHSLIEASVRSQVPEADHGDTLVRYGDVEEFVQQLKIPNRVTGYAYLLDKHNKVRWIGTGKATEQELEYLFSCTEQLLQQEQGQNGSTGGYKGSKRQ